MRIIWIVFAVCLGIVGDAGQAASQSAAAPAEAQTTTDANEPLPELSDLLWVARPVIVFADSPNDPRFAQQLGMLEARRSDLEERDVMILADSDPAAESPLREELRPRGFSLVLIDKDGEVAKRRPTPTEARELIHLIDRMPSRQQEIGSRRQ